MHNMVGLGSECCKEGLKVWHSIVEAVQHSIVNTRLAAAESRLRL